MRASRFRWLALLAPMSSLRTQGPITIGFICLARCGSSVLNDIVLWLWVPGRASLARDDSVDTNSQSRDMICPSSAISIVPLTAEGAGKAGRCQHPQPRVQTKKAHERRHHRFSQSVRLSPRDSLNGLLRALPGEAAFLATVALRIPPANLTPRSRRQDHTTLPYAADDLAG